MTSSHYVTLPYVTWNCIISHLVTSTEIIQLRITSHRTILHQITLHQAHLASVGDIEFRLTPLSTQTLPFLIYPCHQLNKQYKATRDTYHQPISNSSNWKHPCARVSRLSEVISEFLHKSSDMRLLREDRQTMVTYGGIGYNVISFVRKEGLP